jgi:hypothetical protein
LLDELGWVEGPITNGKYKSLNKKLSYAVLEDRLTTDHLKHYITKIEWMMPLANVITNTVTAKLLTSPKAIRKKKQELLKKYEKEIAENDPIVASKIEKELLDYSREYMGDDESMDHYNSGARSNFDNNFKNMYVMKGAVKDPDPNKGFSIITSSYSEGVKREEYSTMANSLAAGPYARSKKTEFGGYMEKLYLKAFESVMMDKPGSDCGTKRHIVVTLDDDMIEKFMYSYIIEKSRLVRLDSTTIDKYRDKTVKMRFVAMCEAKGKKCSICCGDLFRMLNFTNIGMSTNIIPSKLKNVSMKAFHNSTIKYNILDPGKAFGV